VNLIFGKLVLVAANLNAIPFMLEVDAEIDFIFDIKIHMQSYLQSLLFREYDRFAFWIKLANYYVIDFKNKALKAPIVLFTRTTSRKPIGGNKVTAMLHLIVSKHVLVLDNSLLNADAKPDPAHERFNDKAKLALISSVF